MTPENGGRLVPSWLTKAVILAVLALGVGGAGAWVSGVNSGIVASVAANTAQEVRIDATNKRVDDVLDTLYRIEDKVDNINERELSKGDGTRIVYRNRPEAKPRKKTTEEILNGQ